MASLEERRPLLGAFVVGEGDAALRRRERSFVKSRAFLVIVGLAALSGGIALRKPMARLGSGSRVNSVEKRGDEVHKRHVDSAPKKAVPAPAAAAAPNAPNAPGGPSDGTKEEEKEAVVAGSSKSSSVRPSLKKRHHGASSTVRSRSAFTCILCVIAAVVILLPRLACGSEDSAGVWLGPGVLEDLLSREIRDGAALLVAWVAVGVPFDLCDRVLIRGGFAFPLTLSAVQLAACAVAGAGLARRYGKHDWISNMKWREYGAVYVPLGILFAIYIAVVHEAARSAGGGPRIASAFAVAQGVFVVALESLRRHVYQRSAQVAHMSITPESSSISSSADEVVQQQQNTVVVVDASSMVMVGPDDRFDEPLLANDALRRTLSHEEAGGEEEQEEDEAPDCACVDGITYPPGGVGSCLALLVVFGGTVILALGEASVGPISGLFICMLTVAELCVAVYYVAFERRFKIQDAKAVDDHMDPLQALYLASPIGAGLLIVLALVLEISPVSHLGVDGQPSWKKLTSPEFGGKAGGWILALDVATFAAAATIGLAVLKRFSALVLVLFVFVRAIVSLFVSSYVFKDVVTSLEYKGVMVTVLGLVLFTLEVSKAMLQPNSPLAQALRDDLARQDPNTNSLAPSAFLEGDAAEEAFEERQRNRRRRPEDAEGPGLPPNPSNRPNDRHHHMPPRHSDAKIDDDDDDGGGGVFPPRAPLDDLARQRLATSGFNHLPPTPYIDDLLNDDPTKPDDDGPSPAQ